MSDGDDSTCKELWEHYCPCKLTKKNIVLITITILCFALVIWTCVVTIDGPAKPPPSNISYVIIDDSRRLENLNFTTSSALAKAKAAAQVVTTPRPRRRNSFLREILHPVTQEPLCKCMCARVTDEEILTALKFNVETMQNMMSSTSTTAGPIASTPSTPAPTLTPTPATIT